MANGHGGARANSGGARPGAGRKKVSTEEQQAKNRDIVLTAVTEEDLLKMTQVAMSRAMAGDSESRKWISSYVLGNPSDKLDVNVNGDLNVSLAGLRKALGVGS